MIEIRIHGRGGADTGGGALSWRLCAGNPTFKAHGITHFCVPNMTAAVPRNRFSGYDTRRCALPGDYRAARCQGGVDGGRGLGKGPFYVSRRVGQ